MSLSIFFQPKTIQFCPSAKQEPSLVHSPLLRRSHSPSLATVDNKKSRGRTLAVAPSSSPSFSGERDYLSISLLERCFRAPPASSVDAAVPSSSFTLRPATVKKQFSALGTATLTKPDIDSSRKAPTEFIPEIDSNNGNIDDGGDIGGGDIGGGGGDGRDDDDYFPDPTEGDDKDPGGLFRRRLVHQELFGQQFVKAVLSEWGKTLVDLPGVLHVACKLGIVSSAEVVKFMTMNGRPTTTRFISRLLPQGMSTAFIGRMIVDPAFLHKLLLEQAATVGFSVLWELKNRKKRIKEEWDVALVNVLTTLICNAVVFWSLAPCRSHVNTSRFHLQNSLKELPNNIFERNYKHRYFSLQKRIYSFFFKAAELSMVGVTAGSLQAALINMFTANKKERLSVNNPTLRTNALGWGSFLGFYASLRYQLLCGIDRGLTDYFDVTAVALFFIITLRILNVQLGEASRLAWLGIEADPLVHPEDGLMVYVRPSEVLPTSSKNNAMGLTAPPRPKAPRKRIIKKKVMELAINASLPS